MGSKNAFFLGNFSRKCKYDTSQFLMSFWIPILSQKSPISQPGFYPFTRFSVDKKIWPIKIGICASFAVINWNFRFQLFACKCSPFFVASILFSPLGRSDKAPKGSLRPTKQTPRKPNHFFLKKRAVFAALFFALTTRYFDLGSNFTKVPTSQIQIWFP